MKTDSPIDTNTNDSETDRVSVRQPVPREWQFSLRSLLITTTIVSICLALGTYFAGIAFTVLVVVVIQVATLLLADWLMRPANRRLLAFVTAGSWIILGSGLLLIGLKLVIGYDARIGPDVSYERDARWEAFFLLGAAGTFCYWFAWHRWRRLTA